jgi:hypothetical protein
MGCYISNVYCHLLSTIMMQVANSNGFGIKGLWKQVRQEVRQHWFIYSYIAAYIQALYIIVQYCWSTPDWSDRRPEV